MNKWATIRQNQQSDCAPSEDSDQPGHTPSLIRVFAVHMKKAWVLSYPLSAHQRLWSDWAGAQAALSLRWAHSHIVGFVRSWLKSVQLTVFPTFLCQKTSLYWPDVLSSLFLGLHSCETRPRIWTVITVNFLNIRTPQKFVVITLKFELCGSTIE